MKTTVFAIISFFLFLSVFTSNIFASTLNVSDKTVSSDIHGEHIKSYAVYIDVNTDGKIHIKEGIVYDFRTSERHGIYRAIPFIKSNRDGKKFRFEITDIRVKDQNDRSYSYTTSETNGQLELKIGDPDRILTGIHTYFIEYTVSGAMTYFSDHDELYWNAIGADWEVPIIEIYATVTVPKTIPYDEITLTCLLGVSGSFDQTCRVSQDKEMTTISTFRSLDAYEGMTLVVGIPKGYIATLEPVPVISFWETILGKITIVFLIVISIFWYLIFPFVIIYKWYRYGRDPKPPMGETSAWFSPPTGKNRRPLTPAQVGSLVDEVVHTRDIFATIIDLARRGFIKIKEIKKNDFELHRLSKDETVLMEHERELMQSLFEDKDIVDLKLLKLYSKLEKIKSLIYTGLVQEGFFPKNPQSTRTVYAILTGLSLFTMNPTLFITSWLFGSHMPKKTVEGAQAAAIGRSLKNFLKSQEQKLSHQAKNQLFFEKLLPYAVAFGVEKEWAKRFEKISMKSPDWYESSTSGRFNSILFTQSLSRGYIGAFLASTSPPRSSSTGFSSGFSGGSSGGGGGGGGGGSW